MSARLRVLPAALSGLLGAATLVVVAGATPAVAAQPVPGHTTLVPVTPRTDTPRITNGQIWDVEVVGTRVFVAGTFTSISNVGGSAIAQPRLAAYNINTGQVDTAFRPTFDGAVTAVEASPDGQSLYVTGSFNTVNGVTKRKIVKLNPTTGATVTQFTAQASARATAVAVSNNWVYVGGQFETVNGTTRRALVALNPTTGAVDAGFNQQLSGGIGVGGLLTVQQLKLTHNDAKLLVVHTGRQINGQDRYGAGLIDTATKQLLPWRTRLWEENLVFVGGVQRAYAADISPDDSYFVVTSGSGGDRPPINDTAMAFPVNGNDNVQPLWVSRHFDSVYAVAITERAVYVGGHFSWQESPWAPDPWPGLDNVGYGTGQGLSGYSLGDQVVRRDQLGALDPANGKALEWNPGANGFAGVTALEATSRGLFVGVDGTTIGGYNVARHGFFDLTRAPASSAVDTNIETPYDGQVKAANTPFDLTGTAVAPGGVRRVQLEIQQRASKRYLQDDLVTWSTAWNGIDAPLGSPNATSTTWSLSLSIPASEHLVYGRTFAVNGASDPSKAFSKFETFVFDDAPPSTSITAPASGLVTTPTFLVTGSATDDHAVNGLSYYFRNTDSGQYLQDDGSVSASFNTFSGEVDTPGAPNSTWQFEVTLPEGHWQLTAAAIDDRGQSDLRGAERDWTISEGGAAPTVAIATPVVMTPPTAAAPVTVEPGTRITFSGTASDDESLRAVEVFLRNNTTREALASDGTWGSNVIAGFYRVSPINLNAQTYDWTYQSVPLTPGVYDFRVRATDNIDVSTATANQGRLTINVQVPGDAPPDTVLTLPPPESPQNAPGVYQDVETLHLDLNGTATDDVGVSNVRVSVFDNDTGRYLTSTGGLTTAFTKLNASVQDAGATSTSWSLSVDLPTAGEWAITAWAEDTSGQLDTSTVGATARYLIYPGDQDPTMVENLATPADGATQSGAISLGGRATDDVGISRVELTIVNSAGQGMSSTGVFGPTIPQIRAFLTSPGTPGTNFNYTSPTIPAGAYRVTVRAVDNWGQVQQTPRVFTVNVA